MKRLKMILAVVVLGLLGGVAPGADSVDGVKIDSTYKKVRVENRAKYFAEREASGVEVYEKDIYVNDADLREMAKTQAGSNIISIASPTIEQGSRIKKVNVVVDAKRDVTFQTRRPYIYESKEKTRAEIGVTKLKKGSNVKEVNTVIDTKNIVIDSDGRTQRKGVRVTPNANQQDQEKTDE